MKKILSGLLGVAMTVAVIGGVAYAAFTDSASVEGISFTSATAELLVWDPNDSTYKDVFVSNWNFAGIMPGYTDSTRNFWLRNESDSGITFEITGALRTGAEGNWDAWKDVVQVAIVPTGEDTTGKFHTLNEWHSTGSVIDEALASETEQQFTFHVMVDPSATELPEGTTLSSVEFDFTGTQLTE